MANLRQIFTLFTVVMVVMTLTCPLWAEDAGKININTASTEELTQLESIGPKYAERIIEYREKNGPFKNAEDITKVSGIGTKIYELNKDRIVIE